MTRYNLEKFYFQIEDLLGNPQTSGYSIHLLSGGAAATLVYADTFKTAHSHFSSGFMKESNFAAVCGNVEFWADYPSVDVLILNKHLEGMFISGLTPSKPIRIPWNPGDVRRYVADFFDDFLTGVTEDGAKFSTTANKGEWLLTKVDGGSDAADYARVQADAPGGILCIHTNDAQNDLDEIQMTGESFKLAAGKPLYFETTLASDDVDKQDLFVGLAISDTSILAGVTDSVGFRNDHDGNLDALVNQDSTASATDTGIDLADGTLATFSTTSKRLAFYWDGAGKVEFYIDDVLVVTKTDDASTIVIPDDEALSPAYCVKSSQEASVQNLWTSMLLIRSVK